MRRNAQNTLPCLTIKGLCAKIGFSFLWRGHFTAKGRVKIYRVPGPEPSTGLFFEGSADFSTKITGGEDIFSEKKGVKTFTIKFEIQDWIFQKKSHF
jgi:hypothetical protein